MQTTQFAKQKYDIISWITGLEDRRLIRELHSLATTPETVVHLIPAQINMLQMSENDIKNKDLISEEELNEQDKQWFS